MHDCPPMRVPDEPGYCAICSATATVRPAKLLPHLANSPYSKGVCLRAALDVQVDRCICVWVPRKTLPQRLPQAAKHRPRADGGTEGQELSSSAPLGLGGVAAACKPRVTVNFRAALTIGM